MSMSGQKTFHVSSLNLKSDTDTTNLRNIELHIVFKQRIERSFWMPISTLEQFEVHPIYHLLILYIQY